MSAAPGPSGGMPEGSPLAVGWREYVALPDWGIRRILAKADTGAKTGAIDVRNVVDLGAERVAFEVITRRRRDARVPVEAEVVRRSMVRSSLGEPHERLTVRTRLKIGPVEKTVELGLVDRSNMLCRVLLGRRALAPELLVDSGRVHLLGEGPRRTKAPRGGDG